MPKLDSINSKDIPVLDNQYRTLASVLNTLEPEYLWSYRGEVQDKDEFPILIFSGIDPNTPNGHRTSHYCIKIKGPGRYEFWPSSAQLDP